MTEEGKGGRVLGVIKEMKKIVLVFLSGGGVWASFYCFLRI